MNAPREFASRIEALTKALGDTDTADGEQLERLTAEASEAARAYIETQRAS